MTPKKYHRDRLIRLADKLEGKGPYADVGPVPTKKFDLGYFQEPGFTTTDCSTAACACGWAATDPWFRKKGFPQDWFAFGCGVKNFFGLTNVDCSFLFISTCYRVARPRPVTVARRIRTFVEQQS